MIYPEKTDYQSTYHHANCFYQSKFVKQNIKTNKQTNNDIIISRTGLVRNWNNLYFSNSISVTKLLQSQAAFNVNSVTLVAICKQIPCKMRLPTVY